MGFNIPQAPEVPSIIADFPYASMQDAYDEYWNRNSLPEPEAPEGGFFTQEEVDAYNGELLRTQSHNQFVNEHFALDVQEPYADAIQSFNNSVDSYSKDAEAFTKFLFRTATPESLDRALQTVDKTTNNYDLSKIELMDEADYSFNIPGMGTTNVGKYLFSDFTPSDQLLFGKEYGQTRGLVPDHQKGRAYISTIKKANSVLTEQGEAWFAENIDPEAKPMVETAVSEIKGYMDVLNSVGEGPAFRKQRLEALVKVAPLLGVKTPKAPRDMQESDIRELGQEVMAAYAEIEEEVLLNGFSESQLRKAREVVWLRKMTERAREEMVMSKDQFDALYPGAEKSYNEYLQFMEKKIYKDLMSDEQAMLAASYFGEDGVKLMLDEESAIGERNSRFSDAKASWLQGWNDFTGSLDALSTSKFKTVPRTGGMLGQELQLERKTQAEIEDQEAELRYRDYMRNQDNAILEAQKTAYAANAKLVDLFGDTALKSGGDLIDDYSEIMSQVNINNEFTEYIMPAVRAMPQSLSGQAIGLGVTLLSGGNAALGAAATMSWMHGLVASRTYYDSYLDSKMDGLTESQRTLYSQAMGLAEGIGEGADFYLMASGVRALKGLGLSEQALSRFNRGVFDRFRDVGVRRTWGQAIGDVGLNFLAYTGVNSVGEYAAESTTGGIQYVLTQIARGEKIDGGEMLDVMAHDGKVGMYAGLLTSSGVNTLRTAIETTASILDKAKADQKGVLRLYASIIESGKTLGPLHEAKRAEVREAQKKVRELLQARDIQLTEDDIQAAIQGLVVPGLELTEEEQQQMDIIASAMRSQVESSAVEGSVVKYLIDNNRWDLVAEMLERENLRQFYDWALSFDERNITIDENGAARTRDGKLATGYGSRMDSTLGKISEEQKKAWIESRNENEIGIRSVRSLARLKAAQFVGRGIVNPYRGKLKSQSESATSGFILTVDQEGNVTEVSAEQLEALGSNRAGLVEIASQMVKDSQGEVRIVVHTTRDSFTGATGSKGNGAFMETSEEQRAEGLVDEMHIVLDEDTSVGTATRALVHELGHFKFKDAVNNRETRKQFMDAIMAIAETDEMVASLVQLVREEYTDAGYEEADLEKEVINHFAQAVAVGVLAENGMANVMAKVTGAKNLTEADFLIAMQSFSEYIARTTGNYGKFSKTEFANAKIHEAGEQQAQESEQTEEESSTVGESQEAMESRPFKKPFTYLQNTELHYEMVVTEYSVSKRDYENSYDKVINKTVTVKDYNHFRNLYAKLTGNGLDARRMRSIHYFKDGKAYNVKPPKPKTDMRTGEVISMPVPEYVGWQTRQINRRQAAMDADTAIRHEWHALHTRFNDMFRGSYISKFSNQEAFYPYGVYSADDTQPDYYGYLSDVQKTNVLKAAIANFEAFLDMNLTEDQIDKIANAKVHEAFNVKSGWIRVKDNLNIFNAANNEFETIGEKKNRLYEGIERHGIQAWQLLPNDSPARGRRQRNFNLLTFNEIEHALMVLKNMDGGKPMDSAPVALESLSMGPLKNAGKGRGMPKNFKPKKGLISSNLASAMMDLGLDVKNTIVSAHNLDRTRVGVIKFNMMLPNGRVIEYSSNQTGRGHAVSGLLGGPAGPSVIPGLVHSNTNEQSSKDITGNASMAADLGLNYALLFRVLSTENSFNNPLVSKVLIDSLIMYVEEGGEKASKQVSKVLNDFMGNSYSKMEIDLNEYTGGSEDVVQNYSTTLPVSYNYESILKTGKGISKKNNVYVIEPEGVVSALRQIQSGTDSLGFAARGAFVSKMLQPKGGVSKFGFISKEAFIDAVNDPRFKDAKAGDVVAVSVVDTGRDADGNNNFSRTSEVNSLVSKGLKSRVAYNFGVVGSKGFRMLQRFASPEQLDMPYAQRAKMTSADFFSREASLESRRMLGRLHVSGNTKWEQSTPTWYGATLAKYARVLQDKYSDVLLLQQDVEVFKGSKVSESQDFEMAMDLYYGKVRTDLERIEQRVDKINEMAKDFGITPEQLSDYLYAKHAAERNAFIAKRNAMIQEGSGFSDQEAEDILDELDSAEMQLLAKEVYGIIDFTRKYMVEGGLEKRSVISEWESRFDYYVPLNGLAEDQMDQETSSYPTGGAGMAIYGPSVRKARGRTSKTGVNIFGSVVMQAAAVVQRARKDEAMLYLYNLAKNNPNAGVWTVHGPKNRFVSMGQKLSDEAMKAREDVVPLRINGDQHFIKFKNADHAKALNGMTVEQLDYTSRQAAKYVGFLRNSYTVWNPAFFIPNFARDFSSALFNAAAEIDRDGGILNGLGLTATQFNKKLMATTLSTLKSLLQDAHGIQIDPGLTGYMEEWKAAGGRTGWSYSDSLAKVVESMNDKTNGRSKAGEFIAKAWGSSIGAVGEYVEGVNEAFENAVRLASYIEARRAGASKQRAAQLSKNITVNFNKSGELTPSINAWFLFFNAAIQGTSRFSRTFATIKGDIPQGQSGSKVTAAQKLGIGLTMMSFAQTVLNVLISGRDDDDELFYKKDVADYRRQRNFIIMTGERDNIQVPLPYGINLFSNLGMVLAEVSLGVRDIDDAGLFLAISSHSSFSPISFGQGDNLIQAGVSTLMPTFLKPATEVAFNSTYFGGKVFQEQFPFGTEVPEYTLSFRSPEFIVEMNKYLNEMSGGKEFITGDLDFNPDPYYYLMLSMLGGAGKFTGDVIDLGVTGAAVVNNAIQETTDNKGFLQALRETEKPTIRRSDIPFAKIVLGEASRFYDFDLFDENRKDVEQHLTQAKKYAEGKAENVEGVNFVGIGALDKILSDTQDMMSELRSLRREIRQSDDIDYIKKQNLLYMIEQEEMKTLVYFNAKYYDLRGKHIDPRPTGIIPEQTLRQALGRE